MLYQVEYELQTDHGLHLLLLLHLVFTMIGQSDDESLGLYGASASHLPPLSLTGYPGAWTDIYKGLLLDVLHPLSDIYHSTHSELIQGVK